MQIGVLDGPLDMAFSGSGQASSTQVPFPFMVAINGHNYLEDLEFKPWKRQAFRATTVQTTRTQADTSNEPGEQSLSTESLWRRTQDSWHLGAGQIFLDRKNSSEYSFRSSKGVNPWTQWQLTLHYDTANSLPSVNSNLDLALCGSHVYVIDGQALKYTSDLVTWTTVTGTPAVTASSICTDGHNVWVAYGASGVYTTTEGASSGTQYVSSAVSGAAVVRYVLGRLMVASGTSIYNVIASGALPTALFTSNYSSFVWEDFTAGNGVIFAAGNNGSAGIIYSIQINTDATSLSAPIICGQLPNGENVLAIYGYAGSGVAIGSQLGWRFSEQALANGVAGTVALTIGPLNTTPNGVNAFSGYNRFIWGTYGNFDTTSSGLFRMDPSQFISDLAPASASDLMASAQGTVTSVIHFNGNPVFSVAGTGVFKQAPQYVTSGMIDSGFITYGLVDDKMPVFVDIQMAPLAADQEQIQTWVSLDAGTFTPIGVARTPSQPFAEFSTPQYLSQTIEIREVLFACIDRDASPVLQRHTLRSIPAPPVPTDWTVVIQLRERCRVADIELYQKPSLEYAYLDDLRFRKTISTLQIGNNGPYTVTVENIDYIPEQRGSSTGEINGVCVLTCRLVT